MEFINDFVEREAPNMKNFLATISVSNQFNSMKLDHEGVHYGSAYSFEPIYQKVERVKYSSAILTSSFLLNQESSPSGK